MFQPTVQPEIELPNIQQHGLRQRGTPGNDRWPPSLERGTNSVTQPLSTQSNKSYRFSWFISKLQFSNLQIGHENITHAFCLKLVTQKIDQMQLPTPSRIHHPQPSLTIPNHPKKHPMASPLAPRPSTSFPSTAK